jgi:thiol-activated cytolysin
MYQRVFVFTLAFLLILSCRKEDDGLDYSTFTSAIEAGGDFPPVKRSESTQPTGQSESREGDEIWTCRSELVSIEDALGGDNNFSLFSPNANVIFPGNLIQGKSLYKASPDEILARRGGGDITISILDGADVSSVYVDEIGLGSVTIAANEILSGKDKNSVIPSNFQFDKSIVQSERELAFKMRADYENAWASVSGRLSFSSKTSYSRMLVSLHQTFYTLSFTAPPVIDDFFGPDARPEDLKRFIGPGNPPCYISSVNYGRIFYMLVESSASESDLETAVNASFEGLTSAGGGSAELSQLEKFEEVRIKVFALGGDAATTIEAGGLTKTNLHKLNDILKRATDIRTAVPISYKAQSVKTNEVVSVKLATDYERKMCTVTSALPPPAATQHWSGVTNLLRGPVGALVRLQAPDIGQSVDVPHVFFDTTGRRCVLDYKGELRGPYENYYDLTRDNFGTYIKSEDVPFAVGAGGTRLINSHGILSTETIFINKVGNRYSSRKTGALSDPRLVGNHDYLDHFETEGISAICDWYPFGLITVNKQGKRYHLNPYISIATSSESDVSDLTGGKDNNKFLDGISAISRLDDYVLATIDKSGTRYMVVDLKESPDNIKFFGPFKL